MNGSADHCWRGEGTSCAQLPILLSSKMLLLFCTLLFTFPSVALSLDNGLASASRLPPMGWMSWAKFECQVNCQKHPRDCINEQLYKDMAQRLIADGYADVGYKSVHIDDCWMDRQRDEQGRLVADKQRFPSGMASLADFMHKWGLGLGIYEAIGTRTCAEYPGSFGHFSLDAATFADWRVDYLKMDGCNLDSSLFPEAYTDMGMQLNRSGHPIVYACSWPGYYFPLREHQEKMDYAAVAQRCNVWRNYDDIKLSWDSVLQTIKWFTHNQHIFHAIQGPGRWNDPDMLIVGNPELSPDQARVQMSIWAMWSAPLMMSNDLRTIGAEYREILLNTRVIAVDQDPLGEFGLMVFEEQTVYVYLKRIIPADIPRQIYSFALAILNYGPSTIQFSTDLRSLGLPSTSGGISLLDLWSGRELGTFQSADVFNTTIAPTSVLMVKATPIALMEAAEEREM